MLPFEQFQKQSFIELIFPLNGGFKVYLGTNWRADQKN